MPFHFDKEVTTIPPHGFSTPRLKAVCFRYLLGAGATPSLLFLAAITFLNLMLVGYDFATNDQLLYLVLVPRYFDPSTINPNDIYLSLFLSRTYTTFFLMLAPLIRWLGWEWPLFTLFVIVKFFTYWGVWSLAHWLTRDRWAAVFAVLFLLMNTCMNELSVQFYSVNLICRYAVIPFLYFGLKRFWEKRYLASAILFGLAFQIHAMSAIYWIVIIALCFFYNIREILFEERADDIPAVPADSGGWRLNREAVRQLLIALAAFTALALPIVAWSWLIAYPPIPADYSRQDWFEFSYDWKNWYIFYSKWSLRHLWIFLIGLIFFFVSLRQFGWDRTRRWVLPMGIGAVLVMALHGAAAEIHPFQPLYQLQWYRASDVLVLFATIGVARVLSVEGARAWRWIAAVAAACFLTAISSEASTLLFSCAAILLLAVMPFEKKHRVVSAVIVILLVFPVVEWTFFNRNDPLNPVNLWSAPVFWGIAAILFAAIFYLRAPPEAGNERGAAGLFRRQLQSGAGALSLIMLAVLVFFSPEWRWRKHWTVPPPARAGYCWERIKFPGRGLTNDMIRLELWARNHTPPQAMFFVPPEVNGFRVFSERSVVVERFDGEVGIFSAVLAQEWQKRMRLFGFNPPRHGLWQASQCYRRTPPAQWIDLSKKYGAEYLVTDRQVQLPFRQLHQEGGYTIWQITEENSSARSAQGR